MKGIYAISLLVVSNIFMTFAWYGHLSSLFFLVSLVKMVGSLS